MKIFISGAGEVGSHIASSLVREGHDVVVVDKDPERVRSLASSLDVLAVHGDGASPHLLSRHGIQDTAVFFAVSNSDTTNILSAATARAMGAARCVVRVGHHYHADNPLLKDPNITLIFPEQLVAEEIMSMMRVPGAVRARFFENDRLVLLHLRPSPNKDELFGRPLKELSWPPDWVLAAIRRGTRIAIPSGDTALQRDWRLYAVGRTEHIDTLLQYVGVESRPTERVLVAGGGQVGARLCQLLLDHKKQVTLIQRTRERAMELAEQMPGATVLCGDATDPALLREAGVEDSDYFVATTGNDMTNMSASLIARELGANTVVALYNRQDFLNVMRAAQIDLPLSPRLVTAGTIMRTVHGREIVSLDLVAGGEGEVVEFLVPKRARVLAKPLKGLRFPRGSVVGAVLRGEEIFVPDGEFRFAEGDRVVIFTLAEQLPQLEKIFHGR